MKRVPLIQLLTPIIFLSLQFQTQSQPIVLSVWPAQNALGVPRDATIEAVFSETVMGASRDSFVVHGSMTGIVPGQYSGDGTDTLLFIPDQPFFAGEEVQVSLTQTISGPGIAGSELGQPIVWQFIAAADRSSLEFDILIDLMPGSGLYQVAFGDCDNDGDLDLVAGYYEEPNRYVRNWGSFPPWRSNGVRGISPDTNRTLQLGLVDMDRDGDLDLIEGNGSLADQTSRTDYLYLNGGLPSLWESAPELPIGTIKTNTGRHLFGDVDGDGDMDLIVEDDLDVRRNILYFNNGSSDPFFNVSTFFFEDGARFGDLGDVDNDGDLDFVVGGQLFLNNGTSAPFEGVESIDFGIRPFPRLADLNGDNYLDILYHLDIDEDPFDISYLLNNGTSNPFEGSIDIFVDYENNGLFRPSVADIDGDSDLDLLVAQLNGPDLIYLNDGTSAPFLGGSGVEIHPDDLATRSISYGDVDGDGDLDLASINLDGNLRVYINSGYDAPPDPTPSASPTAAPTESPTATESPTSTSTFTPAPTWTPLPTYTPQPTWTPLPTYTPQPTFTPAPTPLLGDLDGDGKVDATDQLIFQEKWHQGIEQ